MKMKKIVAIVMALLMFMTMMPSPVMGTAADTESDPVIDVELATDIPSAQDTGAEGNTTEYTNELDISPLNIGNDSVRNAIETCGYVYLSTSSGNITVFADAHLEKASCLIDKEGSSVLLADGYEGNSLHVRFADQNGNEHTGYIGVGSYTILTDKEASDIAESFEISSVHSNGTKLYITTIYMETETKDDSSADLSDDAIIAPDNAVISTEEDPKSVPAPSETNEPDENPAAPDTEEAKQDAKSEEVPAQQPAEPAPVDSGDKDIPVFANVSIEPVEGNVAEPPEEMEEEQEKAEPVEEQYVAKEEPAKEPLIEIGIEPVEEDSTPITGEKDLAPQLPMEENAIKASEYVEIDVLDGSVPAGAMVVSSQYSDVEAKRIVDKYVFGKEEEPVLHRGGFMKSMAKAPSGEVEITPELTDEYAQDNYAAGVTVTRVPGKVKTDSHPGYAVFSVAINVNGEEYADPGNYSVTIYPENTVNIRDGIREDASIENITFDLYHIHDGVEKITLSNDNVFIEENGTIDHFTYNTTGFSDFILYYTVDFSYTDTVTQITTPEYSIVGSEGETVNLSALLSYFNIYESLVNSTVSFTDDTLLMFEPVKEDNVIVDYIIHSLCAFDTTETLTVYLNNGKVIKIEVKDAKIQVTDSLSGLSAHMQRDYTNNNPTYNMGNTKLLQMIMSYDYSSNTWSEVTSIFPHTVTVNNETYNAFCCNHAGSSKHINGYEGIAKKATSVSFRDIKNNADALKYIGMNVDWSNDSQVAYTQWAVWTLLNDGVNDINKLTAGKTSPSSDATTKMRKYVNKLISDAKSVQPETAEISVTKTDLSLTDGKYKGTVTVTSNGSCVIAKSSIVPSDAKISGATSSDSKNYYLDPGTTTLTVTSPSASFEMKIKAWTDWDLWEAWVAVPEESTDQYLFFIAKTGSAGATKTVRMQGPQYGSFELTKKDADDSSKLLAGAKFSLTGKSVTYAETIKETNSNGVATWDDLPAGTYTLKEVSAPAGYDITFTATDVTIVAGEKKTVTATDKAYAYIKAIKVDAEHGNKPLAGAVFTVTNSAGTTVATLTTGDDGTATTGKLPFGTYTIKETTAPTGYFIEGSDTATVTLSHSTTTPGGTVPHTRNNKLITGDVTAYKYREKLYSRAM